MFGDTDMQGFSDGQRELLDVAIPRAAAVSGCASTCGSGADARRPATCSARNANTLPAGNRCPVTD